MIKQLTSNVIYVSGEKNSAIYDFSSQKVFSINDVGTKFLNEYIESKIISNDSNNFITQVKNIFKINEFEIKDYCFGNLPNKKLQFVWLEVTQSCNCRCIHCYEGNIHKECTNPLTFNDWIRVIDDIAELNCKEVRFIGGEPTLYKRISELIDYAKHKGIEKVSIFSNLLLIDNENILNSIINNNVDVHFSIYASNSSVHDMITNHPGSFEKLINNIKLLKRNFVNLVAHVVVIKENQDQVDEIYKLLSTLGIENIKYDEFRKVYGSCNNRHIVTKSRLDGKRQNFKTSKEQFNLSNFVNTCWFGKCVISSDGNVFPCEFERNYFYGNVNNNSIKDIIFSDAVDKYWFLDYSKIDTCKDCELRFACRDCRPLSYAQKGNLLDKNPRCSYNPNLGSWN